MLPIAETLAFAARRGASSGIQLNRINGAARKAKNAVNLQTQYPGARVQNEVTLLGKTGTKVVDPLTNSGRRIDHAVIQDGHVLTLRETTSLTATKAAQIRKKLAVRANGGTDIRDRTSGQLIDVSKIQTQVDRLP